MALTLIFTQYLSCFEEFLSRYLKKQQILQTNITFDIRTVREIHKNDCRHSINEIDDARSDLLCFHYFLKWIFGFVFV